MDEIIKIRIKIKFSKYLLNYFQKTEKFLTLIHHFMEYSQIKRIQLELLFGNNFKCN